MNTAKHSRFQQLQVVILSIIIVLGFTVSMILPQVVFADHQPNHDPQGNSATSSGELGDEKKCPEGGNWIKINNEHYEFVVPESQSGKIIKSVCVKGGNEGEIEGGHGYIFTTPPDSIPVSCVKNEDSGQITVTGIGTNHAEIIISGDEGACAEVSHASYELGDPPQCPAAQSCPTQCGYAGGQVPDGNCGQTTCAAVTCSTSTPTPTPTPTPSATPTPTPGATPTPTPSNNDDNRGGTSGTTTTTTAVASASVTNTSEGEVLGASTMAATGVAEDIAMTMVGLVGMLMIVGSKAEMLLNFFRTDYALAISFSFEE